MKAKRILRACLLILIIALLAVPAAWGFSFSELHRFPNSYPNPSGLTEAGDGALYGTGESAGDHAWGFVFRLGSDGLIVPLVSFAWTNGATPKGRLLLGSDGALYGSTTQGGAAGFGTIFRVTTNGILSTLISFTGANGPYYGSRPLELGLGHDGALYGCTEYGVRACFRVTITGEFSTLAFYTSEVGSFVNGPLTEGADGAFYGTMLQSGPAGKGTLFRVSTNGSVNVVAAFGITNGGYPRGALLSAADGALYGTTSGGGEYDAGTLFRYTPGGTLTNLYHFHGPGKSQAGVVQDKSGALYGTIRGSGASFDAFGYIFRATTNGAVTLLQSFWGTNGGTPLYELTVGADGQIYGTTSDGGAALAGTAFRISTNGDLTTLASFRPKGGIHPESSLIQTSDGSLWGTTTDGGTNGVGTVFRASTNGGLLSSFSLTAIIGSHPSSPLLPAPTGGFYATAESGGLYGLGSIFHVATNGTMYRIAAFGGTNGANPKGPICLDDYGNIIGVTYQDTVGGGGNVFRAGTNGLISVLAWFDYYTKGAFPQAGLIRGRDGAFYGTASAGGPQMGGGVSYQGGTVFRVTTNGALSIIGSFNPTNFGSSSRGTLVEYTNGVFYGTTFYSPSDQAGSLFRVTTNGGLTRITTFSSYNGPRYPQGALLIGGDGALYGTTIQGGPHFGGTVFRVTTNGSLAVLFSFDGFVNGQSPAAGLTIGHDGKFYCTTSFGQGYGGTIFSLDTSSRFQSLSATGQNRVLSLSGMPGVQYRIQRATSVSGPWANLATVTPNSLGLVTYTNSSVSTSNGFYRARIF